MKLICREEERLSAAEAFQHPWFEKMRTQEANESHENEHSRQLNVARALANLRNFSAKDRAKQAALGYLIQHFMNM